VLINVPMVKGFAWQDSAVIAAARAAAEQRLAGQGRVLLRASGTEPLLRIMVEGRDAGLVRAQAEALAQAVRAASA